MLFDWYKIFSLPDFLQETPGIPITGPDGAVLTDPNGVPLTTPPISNGLVQKTYRLELEGRGLEEILVMRGNETSIVYDGVLLPVGFLGKNPYVGLGEQYAIYKDADEQVWLGFRVAQ
jgi:hypothetical protein